ncbi:MAG TPA: efflux RND transporter permease subunit, partial [Candidatus Aminicenantes bacterium]|nr:efflux RND transporter permease subunit [Candidatus Aminicenantes bacterium]
MKFFTGRPILALVILSTLALLGVYSLSHSPVELVPDEKLPALTITAQWPGASPEMVMSRLALPIEEEVTGLKWIAQVHSRCRENHCQVSVECQRDADMNFVTVLLKERMNRLRSELPPQVAAPQVMPYVPEQFQKKAFMTLSFFGDSSVHTIRSRVDREVVPALKSLAGIQGLEVVGGVPMEIEVVLDLTRLQTLGLDPAAVAGAVSGAFPLSPSTAVRRQG